MDGPLLDDDQMEDGGVRNTVCGFVGKYGVVNRMSLLAIAGQINGDSRFEVVAVRIVSTHSTPLFNMMTKRLLHSFSPTQPSEVPKLRFPFTLSHSSTLVQH